MANEFNLTLQSGKTCYVIVRRRSDAFAWDDTNSGFETWDDGSIDDYDLPLTDDGGDLYSADFPTAISAGTRVIVKFYVQKAASPAITDLLLGSRDITWNGSSASEGGSITLDARALTTLESVKRFMHKTDSADDDFLTELINQISDKIERMAGRRFASQTYHEWHDGTGQPIKVRNWPIITCQRVAFGDANAFSLAYTGSAIRATVDLFRDDDGATGGVRLHSTAANGTVTTTTETFADNASASALVTALNGVSDWTVTLLEDTPSLDLNTDCGGNAKDTTVNVTFPDTDNATARIDSKRGLITGVTTGDWPQSVLVHYTGGYATIPNDVNLLANEMVNAAFTVGRHDPNVTSESLGDYSYSLASTLEMTERWAGLLAPYMEIR